MALKLRTKINFPATVTASGGLKVAKSNGIWTVEPDFSQLAALTGSAVTDPSLKQIWLYDPTLLQYNVLTLAGIGDALYLLTSTTSNSIGTGSKTFTVQSSKDIAVGSWLLIVSNASPATNFLCAQVTAYSGTSLTVNVTYSQGTGTHTDWTMRLSSPPGSLGQSAGYSYSWSVATTSADPGAGIVKANNATFASITSVYISETDNDGNALASELATWSTSTSIVKGRLKIYDPMLPTNFMTFDVTARTDNGAWDTYTVTPIANGGSFAQSEVLRVHFTAKGDKGDQGAGGSGVVAGGTSGQLAIFSGTTAIGSGVAMGTSASNVVQLNASAQYPAADGSLITKVGAYLNALDYGVAGNGVTNDATALNALFTTAATAGRPILLPGNRTYELGSSSLTVPDGVEVHCGPKAKIRRSSFGTYTSLQAYTGAMIAMGSYCRWVGGELNCSAYLATSVTSNTIAGSGSKTWTIDTGLALSINDQIRLENSAGNYMEGTVTAYNSGTGSVTITVAFSSGSGTYSAWNVMFMSLYLCPLIIRGATETHVSNVRTTGNWYVGPTLDGSSSTVSHCSVRSSYSESVRNRGFYMYGEVQRCTFHDLHVIGNSFTDYGINLNPAGLGSIQDNTISQCYVDTTLFQGYEVGDNCFYNVFDSDVAANTNIGYLIQLANGNQPQYNVFSACVARACVTYGFATLGALYTIVDGSSAVGCGVGFFDGISGATTSQENSFTEILATSNTTGVNLSTGSVNARASGRTVSNTTGLTTTGSSGALTGSLATT